MNGKGHQTRGPGREKREEGRESIRGGGGSVCCAYILWWHPTVAVMKYREKQEALWCDSGPVHFTGTERGNTHKTAYTSQCKCYKES